MALENNPLVIGIDVGTSGCRAIAIDNATRVVAEARTPLPEPLRLEGGGVEQDGELWWQALRTTLAALLEQIARERVAAIAVDGTSGTVLVTDQLGLPLHPALMYSDNRAIEEAQRVASAAPRESAAHGANASLAKLLWLLARYPDIEHAHAPADWLASRLCGVKVPGDANSMVKFGWDPLKQEWPDWLTTLGVPLHIFPEVVEPGTPLGKLASVNARRFGLSTDTLIVAGTSDSTAAIIATGASEPGDAITSLGSTLVTKVVSERPIFAPEFGVYSQPYGKLWLVGGGSNTGGAVLRHYFTPQQIEALTPQLDPESPTGLDYYPLLTPGERFPVNDPQLHPRLAPRPADDRLFLQGILEGIARIEAQAYARLTDLGAPAPRTVRSVGGGANNMAWQRMRERMIGVPVVEAEQG
ncbi:MAG TPA: FGGY-family carbohydrate kinase, partial [Gammaproteobacteria bacterium]